MNEFLSMSESLTAGPALCEKTQLQRRQIVPGIVTTMLTCQREQGHAGAHFGPYAKSNGWEEWEEPEVAA